jgi:hypothetical protein
VEKWTLISKLLKKKDQTHCSPVKKAVKNLCKNPPACGPFSQMQEFSTGSTAGPQIGIVEKIYKSFYFSN